MAPDPLFLNSNELTIKILYNSKLFKQINKHLTERQNFQKPQI